MTKIFTKLRALVDEALSDRDAVVDKAPVLEKAPLEQDLFDHRLLYIEEDMVNRMLRAALRNHWFFYAVTFEFEPNNQIFLSIITKWGNVINVEFTLEDLWFDDYSSSFAIRLDTNNIDTGGFILNSILHLLGNWCLSLFGIFFNPIALGEKGSTVRFEKKGIIQFDLLPNTQVKNSYPCLSAILVVMDPFSWVTRVPVNLCYSWITMHSMIL